MGLKGKLTAEVEVSSHGHHIHEFFAKKPHHISQISPTHIQGCEVHEGEFGKPGSIIYWNYTFGFEFDFLLEACMKTLILCQQYPDLDIERLCLIEPDGKACVAKEVIEKLDEENKTLTYRVIEGDLLKEYSSFIFHIHATDKEVKWVLEYEKIHEDVPHPTKMLDLVLNLNKHIDDHHLKP